MRIYLTNIKNKPLRSFALCFISFLLSFAVLSGSFMIFSLKNGFSSLEDRLGADIMVVPYEATTKANLSGIVLQGNTGYFYMDEKYYDKIKSLDGIGNISAQFYLASLSSSCCSIPVEIIGIEPESDFTVQPWILKSYGKDLEKMDIVVGNDLNAFVGDTLTFYDMDCSVVAKLDKTGTSMDTTVYTSEETIKELISSSVGKKMNLYDVDPDNVVSCVLIKVAEGYTVDEVLNDINLHVRKVVAVKTDDMITDVQMSLKGTSSVIGILIVALWVLCAVIMIISFAMITNERKREFAIMRVIGASRKKLLSLVMKEAGILIGIGGLLGALLGLLIMVPFRTLIEDLMGLPFLMPGAGSLVGIFVGSFLLSVSAGAISAGISAVRLSRIDAGTVLREGN